MRRATRIAATVLLCVAAVGLAGCDLFARLFGNDSIELTGIDPDEALINESITISIHGHDLGPDDAPGLTARLVTGATVIYGTSINYISSDIITAQFDLDDLSPTTMDVYVSDEDGREGNLPGALTVSEYEIVQASLADPVEIDISGGDAAYDFSVNAGCVVDSAARDVTFTLDGDGDPALTETAGANGGVVIYPAGFSSLEAAANLESNLSSYAGPGDGIFPCSLNAGDYYGVNSVSEPDTFVVVEIVAVDTMADTAEINYMIVRLIETTD